MKKILFSLLLIVPAMVFAQGGGFTISGRVTGFADGTKVSFYNRQVNTLDSATVIYNDSFYIKGENLRQPEFKFLVFDEKDPAIPLLMDNSDVRLSGTYTDLRHVKISGSALHDDYQKLSEALQPYEAIFQSQNFTKENVDQIAKVCESFVDEHPASFVSLLAVSQLLQVSQNPFRADSSLKKISQEMLATDLGKQLSFQIGTQKTTAIGSRILPFSQQDMNGKKVSITDFSGKYVLIDFWASWCRPCRMENPNVVVNYNRFKDKNFTVLGVSLDQSRDSWIGAVKMDKLDWTQVSDLKGWRNAVSTMFHITSIPQNILIDPQGVIIAKNLRGAALGEALEKLLSK